MKSEQTIQNEIIIAVNRLGHRLWRSNAGKVITKDNRVIQLFPKGFPDTVGFRKTDGKIIFIEVKTDKGRLRPEQEKFRSFIETQPVLYGVARSVEDAIKIIEGDSNGTNNHITN
ncbi:VRR-NUC domain-containing protein [Staphylococcus saprophyticus]|nr:VRR-NUC domain-containing protein [Staphylococcus saprophyticus]